MPKKQESKTIEYPTADELIFPVQVMSSRERTTMRERIAAIDAQLECGDVTMAEIDRLTCGPLLERLTLLLGPYRCNFRCPNYCYTKGMQARPLALPLLQEVTDWAVQRGIRYSYIVGLGEVTLLKDFWTLMDYQTHLGLPAVVFTNGSIFVDERLCQRILHMSCGELLSRVGQMPHYWYVKCWSSDAAKASAMVGVSSSNHYPYARYGGMQVPQAFAILHETVAHHAGLQCLVTKRNIAEFRDNILPTCLDQRFALFAEPLLLSGNAHNNPVAMAELLSPTDAEAFRHLFASGEWRCASRQFGEMILIGDRLSPGIAIEPRAEDTLLGPTQTLVSPGARYFNAYFRQMRRESACRGLSAGNDGRKSVWRDSRHRCKGRGRMRRLETMLRSALFVTYFGDYCSLIGLYEFAKRFGSNGKVVAVYVAYCIPPLLMFVFSRYWVARQRYPARQLVGLSVVGMCAVLSLLKATVYPHVLVVALVLACIKESVQILVNVHVKQRYPSETAKKIVADVVAIRFFIMVFGGSLGAYLGGVGRFDLVFLIDAATYLIAAVTFYLLQSNGAAVCVPTETGPQLQGAQMTRMVHTFGLLSWFWVMVSALGVGAFMGIEYPLLTTGLGISPTLIWVIYIGHVLGTLLARKVVARLLHLSVLMSAIILSSAILIVAFGSVGAFGTGLLLMSVQIGLVAFVMVILETLSNYHLMRRTAQQQYPLYNLQYRILYRLAIFLGALMPLFLLKRYSLVTTNALVNSVLLGLAATVSCLALVALKRRVRYEVE
ncbi:MAG: hypothetical protein HYV02_03475 [Deltaproteobacteria bacterium]|nr:hypothetical protein [Deltaproteobacteria bacterium]